MRVLVTSIVLLGSGWLAGCAAPTLTRNQCGAGDWETVGYRDGSSGFGRARLLAHQEACGEHGVTPDREQYLSGWEHGIRSYCTADNGFALGERGAARPDVCPEELREDVLAAYDHGRELYDARSDVRGLESTLDGHRHRIDRIDGKLRELAAAQINPELRPDERVELFARTQKLLDERKRLEEELPEIRHRLDHAVARLARIETGH